MLDNSEIELKLTNSADQLHYKNKEFNLFENSRIKNEKSNNENKKISKPRLIYMRNIIDFQKKPPKTILYYEKYSNMVFNIKYSNDKNFYNIKVINDIINNESTNLVAEFKDFLIYGDDTEFLHDNYNIAESKKYLPKIFDYYLKCSVIFPNYIVLPESKYIFKNIRKKQKVIDNQQEQEDKREKILKGEIEYEDNDVLFTSNAIYTILNQTNTSHIKKIFGMNNNDNKEEKNNTIENKSNSLKNFIDFLKKEEKKNKVKKKIISKIIKKKQLLNLKNSIQLKIKFKSKIINNINLGMNIKGRNNKLNEDNRNKNIFYTNTNAKNSTLNNIKKINNYIKFNSKQKSKILNNMKINNYIIHKKSNVNKIKNENLYSLITDSKINYISINKSSYGKKTVRIKSKRNHYKNIKSNNNSTGKNKKKNIEEYFKRKISSKANIIRMFSENNNKNRILSPKSISKRIKKENNIMTKRPVSLTPSLTNIPIFYHKTKKIYNRNNSNLITNKKQKNKIYDNKKNNLKNDKKFNSIIMNEITLNNNNNTNFNSELKNKKNYNYNKITHINSGNKYNNNSIVINKNYKEKEISMNLYKVNSLSNIRGNKRMKKNSKIFPNKHNSTLTGTTACSYMKNSSIYYDKKISKSLNKKNLFNKKEIIINEPNNKRINKRKNTNNIISKQFPISSSNININSNPNKIILKSDKIYYRYFPKYILSTSPSFGYISNKKNLLYEKQIKKNNDIFLIKKTYLNLKENRSLLNSRMSKDMIRTRIIKTINNDRIYSIYKNKKNSKNINKSWNLKSLKNIKNQINNSNINTKEYLITYYGSFKSKK